jgi:hypothetical protein
MIFAVQFQISSSPSLDRTLWLAAFVQTCLLPLCATPSQTCCSGAFINLGWHVKISSPASTLTASKCLWILSLFEWSSRVVCIQKNSWSVLHWTWSDNQCKRTKHLHSLDKLTCGVVLGAHARLAMNPDHYRSSACSPERFGELESVCRRCQRGDYF